MTPSAVSGFDWDRGNARKCEQHGVSRADIEAVFQGQPAILPDLAHAQGEVRFLAIGRALTNRHVFIAFTIRERDGMCVLRPISARYMHRKEIAYYEKAHPAV